MNLEETVLKMYNVGGLKFGEFKMRTGELSPVYVDMRVIWSYPDIVKSVSSQIWQEVEEKCLKADILCGLPYQGIPLATYLSTKYDIPMLLKRQTVKTYGTCHLFEGHYKQGDKVLLIDDVIMTGGTLIKDIPVVEAEGMHVIGTAVFIDRDQGGTERVRRTTGKETYSVLSLPDILRLLLKHNKVTQSQFDATIQYLKDNRFDTETKDDM